MKLYILMTSLVLVSLFACQKTLPEPTMDREKLINVMADVHFAEAAIANVFGSARDSLADVYYNQIYQIHNIDSIILQEQIGALRKNPMYMKTFYEDALIKVNEIEVGINKKE